jgi:hypothetical protein
LRIPEWPAGLEGDEICDDEDCENGYDNDANLHCVLGQQPWQCTAERRVKGPEARTTRNVLLFSILFFKTPSLASRAGNNIVLATTAVKRQTSNVKRQTLYPHGGLETFCLGDEITRPEKVDRPRLDPPVSSV